jgi:hypothetical protein
MVHNQSITSPEQLKSLGYLAPGAPAGSKTEEAAAGPTPTPATPWFVELNVCDTVRSIAKKCPGKTGAELEGCTAPDVEALKSKVCGKASSFNYRKKCEFMRIGVTLRLCNEHDAK